MGGTHSYLIPLDIDGECSTFLSRSTPPVPDEPQRRERP
jgi:hypothetical protein